MPLNLRSPDRFPRAVPVAVLVLLALLWAAPSTLAQGGDPSDLPHRHDHDPALQMLGHAGVDLGPQGLMEAVRQHPREAIRMLAARTLARQGIDEAIPILADAARSDVSEGVRSSAATALCTLGGSDCTALAKVGLDRSTEPGERLRWAVLWARYGGEPVAAEIYESMLDDPDQRLAAIGKSFLFFELDLPGFDVIERLKAWATAADAEVRGAALDQLAQALRMRRIDLESVEELLVEATGDDDEEVRERAEDALAAGRLHQPKDRHPTSHDEDPR